MTPESQRHRANHNRIRPDPFNLPLESDTTQYECGLPYLARWVLSICLAVMGLALYAALRLIF